MYVKTGSYTGNGSAGGQAITGVGFQPRMVWVKRNNASNATFVRIESMTANNSKALTGANAISTASAIKSLDADGFTLSDANANVNQSATTYMYLAIGGEGVDFQYGTYTGNGSDNRDITIGGTFSGTPNLVIVIPETAVRGPWRSSDFTGDDSMNFSQTHTSNLIQGFGSGTFQVGTGMNTSSTVYDWVAFKKVTGVFNTFKYTGTGSDNLSITGLGFQPTFALTQANNAQIAVVRNNAVHVGDSSCDLTAANNTNLIQQFISDGIEVGDALGVNQNTIVYYGFAFKDLSPTTFHLTSSLVKVAAALSTDQNFSEHITSTTAKLLAALAAKQDFTTNIVSTFSKVRANISLSPDLDNDVWVPTWVDNEVWVDTWE